MPEADTVGMKVILVPPLLGPNCDAIIVFVVTDPIDSDDAGAVCVLD